MKDEFVYQPPTDEQKPKYAALRESEEAARVVISNIYMKYDAVDFEDKKVQQECYTTVNASCKAFAEVCEANCPPSADLSAAIRCIRLARMLVNEDVSQQEFYRDELALQQLELARMQASSAIALAD